MNDRWPAPGRAAPFLSGALAVLVILAAPRGAAAQRIETVPPDSAAADSVPADPATLPTPGRAFLRSLLIPGWGQATYGAYLRGGIFFAAQAGSGFMLVKTFAKLAEARDIEARRVEWVGARARDSLLALAETDPARAERYTDPGALALDVQNATDQDARVEAIRGLVEAREQQREDWIAMALFVTLMSGVDALVNAHLADFPAEVGIAPLDGGRFTVGISLPTGRAP